MMVRYKSPYSEIVEFDEKDVIVTSGLENIGQEGGTNEGGGTVDDSDDFDW